jgi:glycosyltransferase involved in cell wall biosynthesis
MRQLADGRTNILFVGRIAPNKRQDELAIAFARYLALDPAARLILLGKPEPNDPYPVHVTNTIRALGIEDSVVLPGRTTDAELAAYWRSATLFWSMSEHEGFCVPLIEAMWFDVPVLAFAAAAVPETLGAAGLMFSDKSDIDALAALARLAITDEQLRQTIVNAQRARRVHYLPAEARAKLAGVVELLTGTPVQKRGVALQQLEAQFS